MYEISASMYRLFFIGIFLITTGHLFGQVSHATASATIVTPVGAEISGDINDVNFLSKNVKIISDDMNIKNSKSENDHSFLKIIGESFSYYVTVETENVFKRKGKEETFPRNQESFVSITVNFD